MSSNICVCLYAVFASQWVPRRTKDTAKKLDDLRRELAEQEAQMTRIREDLERKNVGQGRYALWFSWVVQFPVDI